MNCPSVHCIISAFVMGLTGLGCGNSATPALPPTPVDAGIHDAAAPDAGPTPPVCTASEFHARFVAGNLTSGNNQSYKDGPGGRIFKALRPDVALIQEFNLGAGGDEAIKSFVQRYFGPEYVYTRSTGDIPNGVISRWPIVESGNWVDPEVTNRTHAWARILLPGGRSLLAVSVHLKAGSEESTREREAQALVGNIGATNVDYLLLGGDFNTSVRSERMVNVLNTPLSTTPPYPVDEQGNEATSGNRSKPYDWVLVNASMRIFEQPVKLGGLSFPTGLVFDTRVFSAISALSTVGDPDAVLPEDSAASNMQHMAVVRDFVIPCDKR